MQTSTARRLAGCIAILLPVAILSVAALADTGTMPALESPVSWFDIGTWDQGVPQNGREISYIGRTSDGRPARGVVVHVDWPGAATWDLRVVADATLNIDADGSLTAQAIHCLGGDVIVSGTVEHGTWYTQHGGTWTLAAGSRQTHTGGGAWLGGGRTVYLNIMGTYVDTSSDLRIAHGGGAIVNQAGGLVKLNPDLQFRNAAEFPGIWQLSGGQLVVTGCGPDPQNYVVMFNHGSPGGIELSGQGELYVRGDRTGDLTLVDSDGDELLSGAQFAEFGDWTLSDGTEISGYTRFTATEPE